MWRRPRGVAFAAKQRCEYLLTQNKKTGIMVVTYELKRIQYPSLL
jgi:hypothetical protein